MGIFRVRAGEHQVRETPFADFLRRHLRDPNLFTGFNTQTGRWFLGLWVRKDQGLAQDIDDLGENLELANRELVKMLERTREGVTKDDLRRSVVAAERKGLEFETQQAQEFQEVQEWVQKRSGSNVPVLMG
jgi:hypothetical protein